MQQPPAGYGVPGFSPLGPDFGPRGYPGMMLAPGYPPGMVYGPVPGQAYAPGPPMHPGQGFAPAGLGGDGGGGGYEAELIQGLDSGLMLGGGGPYSQRGPGGGMGPYGPGPGPFGFGPGAMRGPQGAAAGMMQPGPMGPPGLGELPPGGRPNSRGGRMPQDPRLHGPQQPGGGGGGGRNRGAGGGKKVQRGLEDNVRRTVYISYIDQQVTEESLATFFADCGTVMDCRICGDPNSAMRFAFIEFMEEAGAQEALRKTGSVLGTSQLRVLPSKTAIVPVNKELMPRSQEELERCSRTVYVANIDKKVEREDVRNFFEQLCGKVNKIRLLGDLAHSTRIAFIEFVQAEAAMAALNCSGALLGSLPLRVSPSKTPVRGDKEDKEGRGRSRRASAQREPPAQQQQQQQQEQLPQAQEQAGEAGAQGAVGGDELPAAAPGEAGERAGDGSGAAAAASPGAGPANGVAAAPPATAEQPRTPEPAAEPAAAVEAQAAADEAEPARAAAEPQPALADAPPGTALPDAGAERPVAAAAAAAPDAASAAAAAEPAPGAAGPSAEFEAAAAAEQKPVLAA